jgi:hypothetical protein
VGNFTVLLSGIELYLSSGFFLPYLSPVTVQHKGSSRAVHPADAQKHSIGIGREKIGYLDGYSTII